MPSDRPKGGRRSEDFPEARHRDDRVIAHLRRYFPAGATRNVIAIMLGEDDHRKITYALHRLRSRGLVRHVPKGNEGHGYWIAIKDGEQER